MYTRDVVLIDFLKELLAQGLCNSATLPDGTLIGADMVDVAFWVEKVLAYYEKNKVAIEKHQLEKTLDNERLS